MKKIRRTLLSLSLIRMDLYAQELPPIKILRAEENYSSLLNTDSLQNASILHKLKALSLNRKNAIYLTLGGEFRPRLELTRNANWSKDPRADETYYSQRIQFSTDLHLGKHVRFFGQLHHGLVSKKEPVYTQSDKLDLHQAFIDFKFSINANLIVRTGRQEVFLGTGRLMALRDGLNIRRSFDMERVIYEGKRVVSHAWYGREVKVPNGVFDNSSSGGAYTWGSYNIIKTSDHGNSTDFYYFGYKANNNKYNDGVGNETRNTIGFRRSGSIAKYFRYNTEINYQFGKFAKKNISAFSIEGDWHYIKVYKNISINYGIKLDYISGDKNTGDNKLGTFNPMFNNPAYFGLINQVAAMNMFDFHPSFEISIKDFKATIEADFYWRAKLNDGLYAATRALLRPPGNSKARPIGWQPGLQMEYRINRYLKLSSETYLFVPGEFVKQTGESENTFYNALTLWIDI